MIRPGPLLVLAALLVPSPARGQSILLIRRASRNEIGFQFTQLVFGDPLGTGTTQFAYREWLRAGIEGVLVSPEVLDFHLALRPSFGQVRLPRRHDLPDQDQTGLGLSLGARVFPRGLLSASLNASRSNGNNRTSIGTETQSRSANFGATLSYRNALLPTQLEYRSATQHRAWLDAAQDVREDVAVERIRLSAKNRKTNVLLERNRSEDRRSGQVLTTKLGEVRHAAGWGKGSRARSSISYVQGTRFLADASIPIPGATYRRITWTEGVHLQHTRTVASDYSYRRSWRKANGSTTGDRLAEASVNAQITRELRAGATLSSQSTGYDGGSVNVLRLVQRAAVSARLPARATFGASASIGYQRSRATPTGDGWVTIVDERHLVGPTGRFTLDNAWVDEASVTVTSSDRSRVYEVAVDYWLVASPPLLDVVVPPAGRIAVGDTLLVNYRHQVFPESRTGSLLASYGATLNLPVLRVYFRRTLSDVLGEGTSAVAGAAGVGVFGDRDEQVVGVGFGGWTPVGYLDVVGERRQLEQAAYDFTTYELRSTLRVSLPGNANGAVGASASRTNSSAGRDDMVSATSSLGWSPAAGLRLEGTFAAWRWERNGRLSKTMGGSLDAEWRIGLTSILLRYSRNAWENGARRSSSRLTTYIARTF